ncbi:kinase-like domain-containing protein [Phaeosphaeria sp. MPI-PUGE-AT-0046c]|nr:kinase-like domain-containing protein [Phaeosphaeria sp. MPI-PUGE-AT-0046c]
MGDIEKAAHIHSASTNPAANETSYDIPEDGTPITILSDKNHGKQHWRNGSQTSLLIEYFEAGNSKDPGGSRPSVRVKVVPRKKTTGNKDSIKLDGRVIPYESVFTDSCTPPEVVRIPDTVLATSRKLDILLSDSQSPGGKGTNGPRPQLLPRTRTKYDPNSSSVYISASPTREQPSERGRKIGASRDNRTNQRGQSPIYPHLHLPEQRRRERAYHFQSETYGVSVARRQGSKIDLNPKGNKPVERGAARPSETTTRYHSKQLQQRRSADLPIRPRKSISSHDSVSSEFIERETTQIGRPTYHSTDQEGMHQYTAVAPLALSNNHVSQGRHGNRESGAHALQSHGPRQAHLRHNASFRIKHPLGMTSKILAEECGWQVGLEKFLWNSEVPASVMVITARGFLGKGTVGIVEEVKIIGFEKTIARKRIILNRSKIAAIRDRRAIQSEVENLRRLDHEHIIKILGCYEEQFGRSPSICALMFPVGDEELGHFLYEECQPASEVQKQWIRAWLKCLASALAYMHTQHIHHEDIKPSNIVHRGENIYFTDFSSSRRLEAGQDTSTESPAKASRLFAAPEAMSEDGKLMRHGSKTDVYSLGLVYVEMAAVLFGKDVVELRNFLFPDPHQIRQYFRVIDKIPGYLGQQCHEIWDHCLKHMLHPVRHSRPSAQNVTSILERELGLGPSSISCSCQSTHHISEIPNPRHRSQHHPVAVFQTPPANRDPRLIPKVPGLAQRIVSEPYQIPEPCESSSSETSDDEATLTKKPNVRSMPDSTKPIKTSRIDKPPRSDHESLWPLEGDSMNTFDDEFVWVQ